MEAGTEHPIFLQIQSNHLRVLILLCNLGQERWFSSPYYDLITANALYYSDYNEKSKELVAWPRARLRYVSTSP